MQPKRENRTWNTALQQTQILNASWKPNQERQRSDIMKDTTSCLVRPNRLPIGSSVVISSKIAYVLVLGLVPFDSEHWYHVLARCLHDKTSIFCMVLVAEARLRSPSRLLRLLHGLRSAGGRSGRPPHERVGRHFRRSRSRGVRWCAAGRW